MLYEIKHRFTAAVLFSLECESLKDCVIAAVNAKTDLRNADLRDAYLRGADLSGADLRGAYLRGADLRDADLRGAYLNGAYLRGADLRDADLRGAYLRGADLRVAYLRGADLRGAYLRDADLNGADLDGANGLIALGYPDSWSAFAWLKDGEIRVQVGCHDKTLAEGRAYWAGKENRREVLAALDYAEAVATIRGWEITE